MSNTKTAEAKTELMEQLGRLFHVLGTTGIDMTLPYIANAKEAFIIYANLKEETPSLPSQPDEEDMEYQSAKQVVDENFKGLDELITDPDLLYFYKSLIETCLVEFKKQPTPQPTDNSDFLEYISNERDSFISFVNSQEWNSEYRTRIESFVIAYDQMRQKIKTTSLERDRIEGKEEANAETLQERQKWFDQKRGENRSY